YSKYVFRLISSASIRLAMCVCLYYASEASSRNGRPLNASDTTVPRVRPRADSSQAPLATHGKPCRSAAANGQQEKQRRRPPCRQTTVPVRVRCAADEHEQRCLV